MYLAAVSFLVVSLLSLVSFSYAVTDRRNRVTRQHLRHIENGTLLVKQSGQNVNVSDLASLRQQLLQRTEKSDEENDDDEQQGFFNKLSLNFVKLVVYLWNKVLSIFFRIVFGLGLMEVVQYADSVDAI